MIKMKVCAWPVCRAGAVQPAFVYAKYMQQREKSRLRNLGFAAPLHAALALPP